MSIIKNREFSVAACSKSCEKWPFFTFGRKDEADACDAEKCDCSCLKVENASDCKIQDMRKGDLYLNGKGKDRYKVIFKYI